MEFFAPTTVQEAVNILARVGPGGRVLAGGTDLGLELREAHNHATSLVYVGDVKGFRDIEIGSAEIRVGSGVTYRTILEASDLCQIFPAIAETAKHVGGPPIQNMGTLGGNIVTASPAGDGIVPLLAFGSSVILMGPEGEREIPLETFFLGPRRTQIRDAEILTKIRWPVPAGRFGSSFIKLGRRLAMAISIVAVSTQLELDQDGVCRMARIALGAVGPTPIRATDAETILIGERLSPEVFEEAGRKAAEAIRPIDDIRASAWYRTETTRTLVARSLEQSALRANG